MPDYQGKICPFCHAPVSDDDYFCSNCGKSLKEKPQVATAGREIWVYFISLFLPPFGLWYVWKYLRQNDAASKRITIIALVLTLVSVVVTVIIARDTIRSIDQTMNSLNGLYY